MIKGAQLSLYISVTDTELEIRNIQNGYGAESTSVKQYKLLTSERSPTGLAKPWGYNSPRSKISSKEIDEKIDEYLIQQKSLLLEINKYRSSTGHVALLMVCEYEDPEAIPGFNLTSKTVRLLHKYSVEFVYDIVPKIV